MSTAGQHIRSTTVTADGVISAVGATFYGCNVNGTATTTTVSNNASAAGILVHRGPSFYLGGDAISCVRGIYAVIGSADSMTVYWN